MSARYARSEQQLERARRTIPLGAQTFSKSLTQFPLGASPYFAARAKGSRVWDVAPGVVLTQAAGHEVWTQGGDRWEPFERFEEPERWQQPLLFADADAVTALRVGALAL